MGFSQPRTRHQHHTMKQAFLTAVVLLAILQPAVEALFLGPIAVGVAIGAIAVTKGLILGSILSRGRTTHRQARSYSGYNRNNTYYTKPKTYYYSSYSYGNHYGKRSAEMMDEVELNRKIREVQDTVMTDEWYMDMVEKDQDDCTKRLICEVSHKKANGKSLNDVETQIVAIFGEGLGVDTSKTTAVFDFAAQAGKYWKRGGIGCDFFRRCETPVDDIL